MAIKHLLPEKGRFYKANLHAHSTLSDGQLSPAEMKDAYKAHGYSVLCITDHELLQLHKGISVASCTEHIRHLEHYRIQNRLRNGIDIRLTDLIRTGIGADFLDLAVQ